ncbi:hypothetical protein ACN28E_54705 [Archangium lansingense]|uniref:hypothetical protein n=1 Tax=Archangium lansingense TaxID=2995310 RepID=UPI003B7E06C9
MMQSVLTGAGAVTSVGRGVAATCAAIHAGIARPRRVDELMVVEPESQEVIALQAHPVHGYMEGFSLLGRWMRLARGCVRDLLSSGSYSEVGSRRFWESTGLTVVVSPPDDQVLLTDEGKGLERIQDEFLAPLYSVLGLPILERNVELLPVGHAGTAQAFEQGMRRFAARELERVLIIAVDSYIDPLRLAELVEAGRLKTEEQPVGFMPGEAGVALLLEAETSARRRSATVSGRVLAVATDLESRDYPRVQRGRALADCLQRILDRVAPSSTFKGDLYNDLNGEAWRAQEWGRVRVRVGQRLDAARWHLPCNSVGDVGAASGALGVCLALHARDPFQDVAVPSIVLSSSDLGEVGGIILEPVCT